MTFKISIDTPALFLTAVSRNRLPVFQTDKIKKLTCEAIDEARTSCGFLLFAYVIMTDHVHLRTDAPKKPSEVLQYFKGIVGHRVIDYLKSHGYQTSLESFGTKIGNVIIGTRCGNMTPMCFQSQVRPNSWRRLTTFTTILLRLDWWSLRVIIVGQA